MNEEDNETPAAFLGVSSSSRTLVDGTLRIQVDIQPADAIGAFTCFGAPGSSVVLARITNESAVAAGQPQPVESLYGQEAKALKLSMFFRAPEVWEAVGTDVQYLHWVKRQPSAYSGDFSEYHDDGESYCVPAHVRRVEHGSGTAIKPPYSAIPLTNREHNLAHQNGDGAIGNDEWWDKMRIRYVSTWAWTSLKEQLGFESWKDVPPFELRDWANKHDLLRSLPNCYKILAGDGEG